MDKNNEFLIAKYSLYWKNIEKFLRNIVEQSFTLISIKLRYILIVSR